MTPENDRLHNATGKVQGIEEWGAFVATEAAATGEFRAAWHEMVPLDETNGTHAKREQVATARACGYTGDFCDVCGSDKVVRNGPCLKCEACGASGGCG